MRRKNNAEEASPVSGRWCSAKQKKQHSIPSPDAFHRAEGLGGCIDRGSLGMGMIVSHFVIKLEYPQHIFILQRNHKTSLWDD
jgi:phage anti-repressor protein